MEAGFWVKYGKEWRVREGGSEGGGREGKRRRGWSEKYYEGRREKGRDQLSGGRGSADREMKDEGKCKEVVREVRDLEGE